MRSTPVATPPPTDRSWWMHEALRRDPGEPCPAVSADVTADVVILGGGYAGMWTAYFLKEREPGIDVVLLEQDVCGGGPSGRNGGFLNGWWDGIGEIVRRFGEADALELLLAAARSVSEIGAWCERHGVDAWFTHAGDIAAASNPSQEGGWAQTLEAAERLGVRDEFAMLTPEDVRARVDSPLFGGALYVPDAATVHPARLARGLRRVLLERGVRIFEFTPVRRFSAGPPVQCQTPGGSVRAGEAVIAVGSWGINWKRFRRSLAVRGSYIVLTAPAPEKLEQINWTGGEAVRDLRPSLHYLRTTPDGRLAFGAAGLQPGLARRIGPRFAYDERFLRRTVVDLHRMFPTLRDVPIEAGWGGPIDVAGASLPFFGTAVSGNVHHGLGFTGNGVGPCHLGGKILASLALHAEDGFSRLAVVGREPLRFPPEPIRSPGMLLVNAAIRRRDEALDARRPPNPLVDLVAHLPRRLGYNLGPH